MPVTYDTLQDIGTTNVVWGAGAGYIMRYEGSTRVLITGTATTFNYFRNNAPVNDCFLIMTACPSKRFVFRIGTPATGTYTLAYEYWRFTHNPANPEGVQADGEWVAFTPVTPINFGVAGQQTLVLPTLPRQGGGRSPEMVVNGDTTLLPGIPIRIRIASGTMVTGATHSTQVFRYWDNTIRVDGYTTGSPANCETIYQAAVAGGWGNVSKEPGIYTIKANLFHTTTGHFKETGKSINIGTEDEVALWSSQTGGGTITLGEKYGTNLNRTANGCTVMFNNVGPGNYSAHGAVLKFYGTTIVGRNPRQFLRQLASGNEFVNVTIAFNGLTVLGGISTFSRLTLSRTRSNLEAVIYPFTEPGAIYKDVQFDDVMLMLDSNWCPTLIECKINNQMGIWRRGTAPAGANRGHSMILTDCDFGTTNKDNWDMVQGGTGGIPDPGARVENFFRNTVVFTVFDSSSNPVSGANIEISNQYGVMNREFSGAYINTMLDGVNWGDTTFTASNGSLIPTGTVIEIDGEIMNVTNRVGNTITVQRGQRGTFTGRRNGRTSSNLVAIQKMIDCITTNANGVAPKQELTIENRLWFGVNTPAPYNTGQNTLIQYNPHRVKARKYGYRFQDYAANIEGKTNSSITMRDNTFVVSTTPATITGIAVNGTTKTITLSASKTIQEIYDYTQYWSALSTNMKFAEPVTTTDGINFICAEGWTIVNPNNLASGDGKVLKIRNINGDVIGAYVYIKLDSTVTGSTYRIASNGVVLASGTTTTSAVTSRLLWTVDIPIVARVRKAGYIPYETLGTLSDSNLNITVSQSTDVVYEEV